MNTNFNNEVIPSLFVSHGNPMAARNSNSAKEYGAWGASLQKPRAILIFSAHWETPELVFGETIQHEKLIYDFYGFPDEYYNIQYSAPGAEWLVDEVRGLLGESVPQSERGLDHGVWVSLSHMWPKADVPILQVSLPTNYTNKMLYELGERLSPLREQGVMIIGGGTLTHNLKEGLSGRYTDAPKWIREFDDWVAKTLQDDRRKLVEWQTKAPEALRIHPTPEHFRPLLIAAGAATYGDSITYPLLGFDMAAFSKRSVQFG